MININITVDSRESGLYNDLIKRDLDKYKDYIEIKKEQLDIGDIIIKYENITYIYERKTINDLLSSIKDGRYSEQKIRLLSNYENINYIIEGDDIISSKNIYNQNILSSIYLYTIYRDKINIFFTKNIEETATFILLLASKISDNSEKFLNNEKKYIDNIKIKLKKTDNIDVETCYILQLSQIPNISKKIATNIKNKYPTIRDLLNKLDNTEKKIELLTEIPNIGINKAKKILEYFNYL